MALWRIRATVDDRPGYLSVLTASLALRAVNILAVQVHTTEGGAVDDFLVDAPDALTEADLQGAVTRGRGRDAFIARAEAQGLADQPTRALALAARLVLDADALGDGLAALLDAPQVTWRPSTSSTSAGFEPRRMRLADPAGGAYEVTRAAPAFTPAEYARAQALVEVAGAVLRHHAEHVTLLLPDGAELVVRPATSEDVPAAGRLHARCSPATRHRRYLGGAGIPSDSGMRRLLQPAGGLTLVAVVADPSGAEEIAAMASLLVEGDLAELAVLVEDGWQRRGVGTALLRRLLAFADRSGVSAVVAHTHADNVAMLRTMRRLGARGEVERDGTVISVTVPLGERTPAPEASAAPG